MNTLRKMAQGSLYDLATFCYLGWALFWSLRSLSGLDPFTGQPMVAIAVLGAFAGGMTAFARSRGLSLGSYLMGDKEKFAGGEKPAFVQRPWLWTSLAFVVLTFYVGWMMTEISLYDIFLGQGFEGAQRIFKELLNPNLGIIDRVLLTMIETVFVAFMATFLALPPGILISFLAAHNIMNGNAFLRIVYYLTRVLMNFARSVEPIIWAIVFSVWVGIGPFAGMLALWLTSIVSQAKLYSEQIECINRGPVEAMESVGANRLQIIVWGVVPQVILPFISFTIYRWDINVRMATVVGIVGGGGIGALLFQYQGLARWREVGLIIMVIAAVVWVLDALSTRIRKAMT